MKKISIILVFIIFLLIGIYFISNPEINDLNKNIREEVGGTYVKLSKGYTHYKLIGQNNKPLIILVHGGTIPMWAWTKQVDALRKYGYQILIYDKYGRGYSDRPNVTYNQELYKNQLFELIEKLDIIKKFDLIGLSIGGGTVVNFTAAYPNKVRKLILISPLINNFKVPFILKIPIIGEFAARLIGINTIVKRFSSLIKGSTNSEKYKQLFIEQTTYKGFQHSLLSMLRNDAVKDYSKAYKILGKQKRDVLLIWGKEDKEITKNMIKDIRVLLPNVTFSAINNGGHGAAFRKHKTVNKLIINFLNN